MRLTSAGFLVLAIASSLTCSVTVILSGHPFLFILAWLPLVAYLYIVGVWAAALPGYVVWRDLQMDRAWASFWLDDGNLALEVEAGMQQHLIPFKKECKWEYSLHYLLPEGLEVGVVRLFHDRTTERVVLMVEGVDDKNWDLSMDVMACLDGMKLDQVSIVSQQHPARVPWGYTARA